MKAKPQEFKNSNYWQKLMKLRNGEAGYMDRGIFAQHQEWVKKFNVYSDVGNVTHENGYVKIEDEQVIARSEGEFIDKYDGETYLFFFYFSFK